MQIISIECLKSFLNLRDMTSIDLEKIKFIFQKNHFYFLSFYVSRSTKFPKILYTHISARSLMVWLRRCTHYLFIVVVAVNSTLLTINSGDYIFYTDWAWTSFVVFSIANTLMTVVGAVYYLTFTGVPGTASYYGLIMQVYTWVAKVAWFALGSVSYTHLTLPTKA